MLDADEATEQAIQEVLAETESLTEIIGRREAHHLRFHQEFADTGDLQTAMEIADTLIEENNARDK